jgi:tetratricopeptide (TPR) repeat protein
MTPPRSVMAWALTIALWVVVIVLHEKATESRPTADALIAAGMALHQKGDLAGALRAYEDAAKTDPRSALAYYDLGVVRYQRHEIAEAEAAYRRCIEVDPGNANAHYNLGYLYSNDKKNYQAALREFESAVRANPSLARAYFEMARAYDALGQSARAVESRQIAVTLDERLRGATAPPSEPPRK